MCKFLCVSFLFFVSLAANDSLIASQPIEKQDAYYRDSSSYDVTFYDINLDLPVSSSYISGYTSIIAKATNRPLDKFYIELDTSLNVDSVFIDNVKTNFIHDSGWVKLPVTNPVPVDQKFKVIIYYRGFARQDGRGYGVVKDIHFNSFFSNTEPFYASSFYPCKQIVSDKCDSANIYLSVPKNYTAVSNGLLKAKIDIADNRTLFKWETRYPTAYYAIAFAVSNYKEYSYKFYDENFGDSILFQNFIKDTVIPGTHKAEYDTTVRLIKLYEKLLNVPYPFRKEKYGHVITGINGGMENQTITNIGQMDFRIVAHELAHSWFGNMVTCSSWQDIWINEGIASYFEYLAYEAFDSVAAGNWLHSRFMSLINDNCGSVFVPENSKWNRDRIFDLSFSYNKGAYVIHMLRNKVNNDSIFFKILQTFLERFAYKNASTGDFKQVAEEVTGLDLTQFFNQWIYGTEFPALEISSKTIDNDLSLRIRQKGSCHDTSFLEYNLKVAVQLESGLDTVFRINETDTARTFIFSSPVKKYDFNPDYCLLSIISLDSLVFLNNYGILKFGIEHQKYCDTIKIKGLTSQMKLKLALISGPEGLTLNDSTLIVEWADPQLSDLIVELSISGMLKYYYIYIYPKPEILTQTLDTAIVGVSYNFGLSSKKVDYQTFEYTVIGLPEYFSISDSFIMGYPQKEGKYPVRIYATNQWGVVSDTLSTYLVVKRVNPEFTTLYLDTAMVGKEFNYTLKVKKLPGFTLSFSSGNLPGGLNLNTTSGEISGIPLTSGVYPVTFYVEDSYQGKDTLVTDLVIKEMSAKVNNFVLDEIQVTPNPAGDLLHIFNISENAFLTLQIYSIDGKLMVSQELNSLGNTINIRMLPSGYYNLLIINKLAAKTFKLIKR